MRNIGIVACSAEGAALCYRTICLDASARLGRIWDHPQVVLHGHSFADYMDAIHAGKWDAVGRLMLSSAVRLADAGADFFICPDNTVHQALPAILPKSPRPWLHIAEIVAREALRLRLRRLGVLGTRYLMEGPVYGQKLDAVGIESMTPPADERQRINDIIFSELVNGEFNDTSRRWFSGVIARLRDRGCDGVVLGCTEIPLLVTPESSSLPTLDSTRLLARAALDFAIAAVTPSD